MSKFMVKLMSKRISAGNQKARSLNRSKLQLFTLESRITPNTYTVSNDFDSGAGSLRQAIADANANSGTDTIEWDGPHLTVLKSSLPTIIEDIIFVGSDKSDCIISGAKTYSIFQASSSVNIQLSNLTLDQGFTSASDAAIYVPDGNLTLYSVTISNCQADNGGGAYVSGGDVLFCNVEFVDNKATNGNGGGLYHTGGDLNAAGENTFRACSAFHASSSIGGGIYHANGDATISGTQFLGCSVAAIDRDALGGVASGNFILAA